MLVGNHDEMASLPIKTRTQPLQVKNILLREAYPKIHLSAKTQLVTELISPSCNISRGTHEFLSHLYESFTLGAFFLNKRQEVYHKGDFGSDPSIFLEINKYHQVLMQNEHHVKSNFLSRFSF